jgi:hypothetical protein
MSRHCFHSKLYSIRLADSIFTVLYTIGAGLEAGARNYGMIVAGRVVLGIGVGLEGGTGNYPLRRAFVLQNHCLISST